VETLTAVQSLVVTKAGPDDSRMMLLINSARRDSMFSDTSEFLHVGRVLVSLRSWSSCCANKGIQPKHQHNKQMNLATISSHTNQSLVILTCMVKAPKNRTSGDYQVAVIQKRQMSHLTVESRKASNTYIRLQQEMSDFPSSR
jgi:hypothetical protein